MTVATLTIRQAGAEDADAIADLIASHAIAWVDERGIHKLTAQVMNRNVVALGVLQKVGFVEEGYLVGQFRRQAGGANDAVLLARVAD